MCTSSSYFYLLDGGITVCALCVLQSIYFKKVLVRSTLMIGGERFYCSTIVFNSPVNYYLSIFYYVFDLPLIQPMCDSLRINLGCK